LEDEPVKPGKSGHEYHDLEHILTRKLPQNIELLAQFRKVLDDKTAEDVDNPRFGAKKDSDCVTDLDNKLNFV
jgi:hypothetical protein